MPLRLRLGLVFALATAVLLGVVGLGFLLQLSTSLDATLDAGLRSRAETIGDQYAVGGLAALRLAQNEEPVQLVTLDGRILAATPVLGGAPVLDSGQRRDALARGVSGSDPLSFTAGVDDDRTRFLTTVLSAREGLLLVVGTGTDISDAADEHIEKGVLLLAPPAVLVAGLGAWWLAGAALRPVERMRRQTAEISERDSGAHLEVPPTRDEVAALAVTMNDLLDRLRGALEHERGFVADAGHELRTPLATLRAELELAARPGRSPADLRAAVTSAAEETERLIRLAEDLLLLARVEGQQPFLRVTTVDLRRTATVAARGAAAGADPRDIDVVVEAPDLLEVPGDPDRIRQALDNLLTNAVRHSPDHGLVVVAVRRQDTTASITVSDHGPGFPPEFLPHAFERFRRADTARARSDGGSGLGLAIVEAIVSAHHGRVRATNRTGGGAHVEMEFPTPHVPASGHDEARGAARPSHVPPVEQRATH